MIMGKEKASQKETKRAIFFADAASILCPSPTKRFPTIPQRIPPRNAKAVAALIDREKLKFAGGELIGLEQQLEALKKGEDTSFLFSEQVEPKLKTGLSHQNNGTGTPDKKDAANDALRSIFKGGN